MKILNISLFVLVGLVVSVITEDVSLHVSVIEPDSEFLDVQEEKQEEPVDLCANVICDASERCIISNDKASCECIEKCDIPKDDRQKVCSSSNNTFPSDCHFLRQKCWCKKSDSRCADSAILNEKLDYYGECRHIGECSAQEREFFPSRMKQWMDEVLLILSQRKDLEPKYTNLVKLADQLKQNNVEKYWTAGVAFEFCQLDRSRDHLIQKEELTSLISSIKALENCIQPFLNGCDINNDDLISDEEWGTCLDLSSEDLVLLKKYC
ncbi:unnamed protein product [Brachionus calyciflorus]|uniref:Kazal-like domain-containing protein n=1 Tax=Brachionus calyciflorus TaxID=104777 RepID=A0A813ZGV2_9BILA|nr:unnamed protein product [Brachionus calyciflorus]